jgi:diguanylate cyclase (GGDEF)-like protein
MTGACRLLIAEDDPTSRLMLQGVLSRWGHEVEAVGDGGEAWEVLQAPGAPRLVILDWMMPGLDGLEVLTRLREQEGAQPAYVILLTARDDKRDIAQALRAGANDYIAKPFDNGELRARVEVGQRVIALQEALEERVRQLEAANVEIARLARTDELTGLANRRYFSERLKAILSATRRQGLPLALIMADLDHFKSVNDRYGHAAGDEVLKEFAAMMQRQSRTEDLAARWGGEEFAILMPHTTLDGGLCWADRLRENLCETRWQQLEGPISASFGVAQYRPGESEADLLRRADEALLTAKTAGRNRVQLAA